MIHLNNIYLTVSHLSNLSFSARKKRDVSHVREMAERYRADSKGVSKEIFEKLPLPKAKALVSYFVTLNGSSRLINPNQTPAFAVDFVKTVNENQPLSQPPKNAVVANYINVINKANKKYTTASPIVRTYAILMQMGEDLTKLTKRLKAPKGLSTKVRKYLGLEITPSRIRAKLTKEQSQKIPALQAKHFPTNWTSSSDVKTRYRQAAQEFAKLSPIAQNLFKVFCDLKDVNSGRLPFVNEVLLEFNKRFGSSITVESVRHYLRGVRTKLEISEASELVAKDQRLKARRTKADTRIIERNYRELPEGGIESVLEPDVKKAKSIFRKLAPATRIVYTFYCQNPDFSAKELVKKIRETIGLRIPLNAVATYVSSARRALGITTTQGEKKKQTKAASEKLVVDIQPNLPQFKSGYKYADSSKAAIIWQDKDPNIQLTPYEKILLQVCVEFSTEQKIASNPVIAEVMQERYGMDVNKHAVDARLASVRKKLNCEIADIRRLKTVQLKSFNEKNHKEWRNLEIDWKSFLKKDNLKPANKTELLQKFNALTAFERLAVYCYSRAIDKNGVFNSADGFNYLKRYEIPPNVSTKDFSATVSRARVKLGYPIFRPSQSVALQKKKQSTVATSLLA